MYFRARMAGSWKFIFFIARKLQHQHPDSSGQAGGGKRVARPITRIATISIALAMIVNIITIAVVEGFQQEVRHKVTGFGAHITIQNYNEGSLFESSPMRTDSILEQLAASSEGVTSIQKVAYKPALFQSVSKKKQREILGVVLKGVDASYNWDFLRSNLTEGRLPRFGRKTSNEILISKRICRDLHYKLGDTARAYFVKQQPVMKQFRIVGIYETGLEDYDKQMIFCDLTQVQSLNDWGIQAQISVDDTLTNGLLIVRGDVSGGNGNYRYNWGKGYESYSGFVLCPDRDTTIRLIASDYWQHMDEPAGSSEYETAIADTAWLKITVSGNRYSPCRFQLSGDGTLQRRYLDNEGYHYELNAGDKTVTVRMIPGKGSYRSYIGAYELMTDNWDQLDATKKQLHKKTKFLSGGQQNFQVRSIRDHENELFVWLGFLDINMAIILLLMLVIGIINMGSALLVMILVRTNFIGILKAQGATNTIIRRIFVTLGGRLILRGMIWGNVIGVGFCLLQYHFGILRLDPQVYYLTAVPVSLSPLKLLFLNLVTIVICTLALLVPSIVVARISPSKAIRFR